MTYSPKTRRIASEPRLKVFEPEGTGTTDLDRVIITLDEFEAVRLSDIEGLYQQEAADCMNISRQTYGTIISNARKKIADFLVNAKTLEIRGGIIEISGFGTGICKLCRINKNCSKYAPDIQTGCLTCKRAKERYNSNIHKYKSIFINSEEYNENHNQ